MAPQVNTRDCRRTGYRWPKSYSLVAAWPEASINKSGTAVPRSARRCNSTSELAYIRTHRGLARWPDVGLCSHGCCRQKFFVDQGFGFARSATDAEDGG